MLITMLRTKVTNTHLFIFLVLLNVLDFISTYIGIEHYNKSEQNPIMAYAVELMNTVWAIALVKLVIFGGIYYRYYHTENGRRIWSSKVTGWMLLILCMMYVYVVTHNYLVILS